jgi:hypothetical protein
MEDKEEQLQNTELNILTQEKGYKRKLHNEDLHSFYYSPNIIKGDQVKED